MEVNIVSFINPHLFWVAFTLSDNVTLSDIEKQIVDSDDDFQVDEMVSVHYQSELVRATIEDIFFDESNQTPHFYCWLVDYGKLIQADKVFKLSSISQKIPRQIKQACLKNVCYIKQNLELGAYGGQIKKVHTVIPESGVYHYCMNLLDKNEKLVFDLSEEEDGILFGDIIVHKNMRTFSLFEELCEKGLVVDNKAVFEKIKSGIPTYKRTHLRMIHQLTATTTPPIKYEIKAEHKRNPYDDVNELKKPLENGRRRRRQSFEESFTTESSSENGNNIASESALNITDESFTSVSSDNNNMRYENSNNNNIKNSPKQNKIAEILARQKQAKMKYNLDENTSQTSNGNLSSSQDNSGIHDTSNENHSLSQDISGNTIYSSARSDVTSESPINVASSKASLLLKKLRNNQNVEQTTQDKENKKSRNAQLLEKLRASRKKLNDLSTSRESDPIDDEGSDCSFENALSSTKSDALGSSCNDDSLETSIPLSSNSHNLSKIEIPNKTAIEESSVKFKVSDKCTKPRVLPQNFMPAGYQVKHKGKNIPSKSKISPTENSTTEDDIPSVVPRKLRKTNKESDGKSSEGATSASEKKNEDTDGDDSPVGLSNAPNGPQIPLYKLSKCACAECRMAYEDDDWDGPVKFADSICKKKMAEAAAMVPVIKPPRLLKPSGEENQPLENDILSIEYTNMPRIFRQAASKLLVQGETIPVPINRINQACLHKDILGDLRRHEYKEPNKIQVYSFPAITRNQHVFMVSDKGSGKTMTYLPVLYSFLLEKNDRYKLLNKMGGGPVAVILCNSSQKCEWVHDYAKKIFAGRDRQVRLHLETYPGRSNVSNIDILITIPTVLNALLNANATNFKRLCHLVLEDGDAILDKHFPLLTNFLALADKVLAHRNCPKAVQIIVCAEHWTQKLEQLFKMLKKVPLVCIGNYLEAALYGKMTFALKFLDSACKEMELKTLLSDVYKFEKSVVICSNDQVEDIQMMFVLWGIDCTAIKNDMNRDDIVYLEEVWNATLPGRFSVLICTDYIYSNMLALTNASLLIHYSLPKSWSQFIRRFSCLLENCPTPLNTTKRKNKIVSVVLIDENCEPHMARFGNYFRTSNLKDRLPKELESFFEKTRIQDEEKKITQKMNICDKLKTFGKCDDISCDEKRHLFDKKLDVFEQLPQNGSIKFKICEALDVNCFSIHILEHYDVAMNKNNCIRDRSEQIEEMLAQNKRKPLSTPRKNHLYMYEDISSSYRERVRLLEIKEDILADIYLIDKGQRRKVKIDSLFKLSDELKQIPPQTITAYLANLIPPLEDPTFSSKSYRKLEFILEENDLLNSVFSAEIHLQLGENLWLKDVVQQVEMHDKSLPTMGYQLSKQIVKLQMAEYKEDALINLYKLCRESGIELPDYQIHRVNREPKIVEQEVPQWAFLDIAGTNEVMFSCAMSPDEFYVKIKKFNQQLERLETDIQREIKKPKYPEPKKIEVGRCYLAPDIETGDYARAMIREITDDGNAFCYFVDHGDEILAPLSELKHITNALITRLPFQAIQCRLIGVKPIDQEWDSAATDLLYDFGYEPNTNPKQIRTLFLRVAAKEQNCVIERQRSYSVSIKGGFGEGKKLLSNLMIDCGLAVPNDEQVEDFVVPEPMVVSDQEFDERDSDENHSDDVNSVKVDENGQIVSYYHKIDEEQFDLKEEDFDFFVEDEEAFVKAYLPSDVLEMMNELKKRDAENSPDTSRFDAENVNNNALLVPMKAAPEVDYNTPTCIWSQTDKYVKLTIKIPDVKEYEIGIKSQGRVFYFCTYKEGKKYLLKIMLFDKVENTFQHHALGLTVKVVLTKLTPDVEWPRLPFLKENCRHIHYDVDTLKFDEEKKKRILTFDFGKEESSSDADDQQDGPYYYFNSDLDSEYDEDIPDCPN